MAIADREPRGQTRRDAINDMSSMYVLFPPQPGLNKETSLPINGTRADLFRKIVRNAPEYADPLHNLRRSLSLTQTALDQVGEAQLGGLQSHVKIEDATGGHTTNLLRDILVARLSTIGPGLLATDTSPETFTTPEAEAEAMRAEMGIVIGQSLTLQEVMGHILDGRLRVLPIEKSQGS